MPPAKETTQRQTPSDASSVDEPPSNSGSNSDFNDAGSKETTTAKSGTMSISIDSCSGTLAPGEQCDSASATSHHHQHDYSEKHRNHHQHQQHAHPLRNSISEDSSVIRDAETVVSNSNSHTQGVAAAGTLTSARSSSADMDRGNSKDSLQQQLSPSSSLQLKHNSQMSPLPVFSEDGTSSRSEVPALKHHRYQHHRVHRHQNRHLHHQKDHSLRPQEYTLTHQLQSVAGTLVNSSDIMSVDGGVGSSSGSAKHINRSSSASQSNARADASLPRSSQRSASSMPHPSDIFQTQRQQQQYDIEKTDNHTAAALSTHIRTKSTGVTDTEHSSIQRTANALPSASNNNNTASFINTRFSTDASPHVPKASNASYKSTLNSVRYDKPVSANDAPQHQLGSHDRSTNGSTDPIHPYGAPVSDHSSLPTVHTADANAACILVNAKRNARLLRPELQSESSSSLSHIPKVAKLSISKNIVPVNNHQHTHSSKPQSASSEKHVPFKLSAYALTQDQVVHMPSPIPVTTSSSIDEQIQQQQSQQQQQQQQSRVYLAYPQPIPQPLHVQPNGADLAAQQQYVIGPSPAGNGINHAIPVAAFTPSQQLQQQQQQQQLQPQRYELMQMCQVAYPYPYMPQYAPMPYPPQIRYITSMSQYAPQNVYMYPPAPVYSHDAAMPMAPVVSSLRNGSTAAPASVIMSDQIMIPGYQLMQMDSAKNGIPVEDPQRLDATRVVQQAEPIMMDNDQQDDQQHQSISHHKNNRVEHDSGHHRDNHNHSHHMHGHHTHRQKHHSSAKTAPTQLLNSTSAAAIMRFFESTDQARREEAGIKYTLTAVQQPKRARMIGFGEKDRRPIDPPPIVQLVTTDHQGDEFIAFADAPFLVMHVSLWSEDMSTECSIVVNPFHEERAGPKSMHAIVGLLTSQCYILLDKTGKRGMHFIFPEISIRVPGRFRLKFMLFSVKDIFQWSEGAAKAILFSDVFTVFTPKDFPGVALSTELSKVFSKQGVRIYIRPEGPLGRARVNAVKLMASVSGASTTPSTATSTTADDPPPLPFATAAALTISNPSIPASTSSSSDDDVMDVDLLVKVPDRHLTPAAVG